MNNVQPILILASASPRRRELLNAMGCEFEIEIADIDESRQAAESPGEYVTRLAMQKAQTVHARRQSQQVEAAVIAADTTVARGDRIFGKPSDQFEAFKIWRELSSSQHHVLTAVALAHADHVEVRTVATMVEFGRISASQMQRYWETGEPADKAGGYAIQGFASAWVKLIHGSYSNVVGLPLRETNQLLSRVGHNWL